MYDHQNMMGGGCFPPENPKHLRCPHCDDDGTVFLDSPDSAALPCPGCAYGRRRAARWLVKIGVVIQVTPSHYRGVSWQNGVTLDHVAICGAPADAVRHPDGYRCRRPALPSTGGRAPLCDVHAAGAGSVPLEGAAAAYVATARAKQGEWDAERVRRQAADELDAPRVIGGAA